MRVLAMARSLTPHGEAVNSGPPGEPVQARFFPRLFLGIPRNSDYLE